MAIFKWGRRDDLSVPSSSAPAASDVVSTSKVLPRLLASLSHVDTPVILDLGPVIGANISFFGEHLSCKIFMEDLFAEVERHAKSGTRAALAQVLPARLQRDPESLDAIFCWDLFDYLDKASAQALATHLKTLLKPQGLLYGFFGATQGEITRYTRFVVENNSTLRLRYTPATPVKRHVLVVRDLNKLFDGLATTESVLLKSNTRETLFRKRT